MKKILFVGGTNNQTLMMYKISRELTEYDAWFSAFYTDGFERPFVKLGLLDFSVLGNNFRLQGEAFLKEKGCKLDFGAQKNNYDLIVTCSDLIVPKNIRDKKIILVQEGMTDPETFANFFVKHLKLPRYLASTSTTGLSHAYDVFCVASEGYREHFIKKGIDPKKLVVTGIPNFDDCERFLNNSFPYKNYVLVCTSDARETYKIENRKKFILNALKIANGRQVIFKLHPNENYPRALKEINRYAPQALVYHNANTNELIANCDVLITKFSTVVYVGLALGKKVYSAFNIEDLKKQVPLQNGGKSASNIARVCRKLLESGFNMKEFVPAHFDFEHNRSYNAAG